MNFYNLAYLLTCERVLSKLKIVKNRLRSTLRQSSFHECGNLVKEFFVNKVGRIDEEQANKLTFLSSLCLYQSLLFHLIIFQMRKQLNVVLKHVTLI